MMKSQNKVICGSHHVTEVGREPVAYVRDGKHWRISRLLAQEALERLRL